MKAIRQKLILFTSSCIIGLLLSLVLYIENFIMCRLDVMVLFALLLLLSNLFLIFLITAFENYRIAKLIVENEIMHIRVAEIRRKPYGVSEFTKVGGFEVFVSCFGILLGSKVIKFNIDDVSLKKVEIGNDFIDLVYGTAKRSQAIKLIHCHIDKYELQNIIEVFRYETGIIPIVVD